MKNKSDRQSNFVSEEDVHMSMLAHMRYSFAPIDWDFDKLSSKEKALIKSQDILDEIKRVSTKKYL